MAIGLENYPNITPPSGDFPSGRIKDNPGDRSGTPINLLTNGDVQEFFAKLMRMADITPNELPDSEYVIHQFIQAFLTVGMKSISNPIIKALLQLQGYITNDVIILSGFDIVLTGGGNTATWTAGDIYYNGNTYTVAAGSVSKSNPQTYLYVIDSEDEFTVTLIAGTAGDPDAIAEYGDATIKELLDLLQGDWVDLTNGDLDNGWILNPSGGGYMKYRKDFLGMVHVRGYLRSPSSSSELQIYEFPSTHSPSPNNGIGGFLHPVIKLGSAFEYVARVEGDGVFQIFKTDGTPPGNTAGFVINFSYPTR